MIAKAIRRRFGLHARRVSVRTEMPGHLRLIGIGFIAAAVGYFGWIAYLNAGSGQALPAAQSAVGRLENENAALTKHNAALRSELAVLERHLQIEPASHADLAKQVKALTEDNARVKEDVALVEAICASDPKADGIQVSSARIRPSPVPGEYGDRIVLLQIGPRLKPFQGSYQLVINLTQDGARRGIIVPSLSERGEAHDQLDFRVHHRIDGTFKINPAAVVRSLQVRVFEAGQSQPKLMQTVTLS